MKVGGTEAGELISWCASLPSSLLLFWPASIFPSRVHLGLLNGFSFARAGIRPLGCTRVYQMGAHVSNFNSTCNKYLDFQRC
jgi:hypothetical protein